MQIKKTQTNKQQFKPNQAMKAKKMTQKLTLLTFTALFIAFMFNACSDVAGPNEGISETSDNSLISQEHDGFEDIRRRIESRRTAAEEVEPASCYASGTAIIGYGSNFTNIGTLSYSFDDNGVLTLKFETDDGFEMDDIKIAFSNSLGDLETRPGQMRDYMSERDANFSDTNEYEVKFPGSDQSLAGPNSTTKSLGDIINIGNGYDIFFRIHVGAGGETAWPGDDYVEIPCNPVGSFGSTG
jgi:hypothetical protein